MRCLFIDYTAGSQWSEGTFREVWEETQCSEKNLTVISLINYWWLQHIAEITGTHTHTHFNEKSETYDQTDRSWAVKVVLHLLQNILLYSCNLKKTRHELNDKYSKYNIISVSRNHQNLTMPETGKQHLDSLVMDTVGLYVYRSDL